MLYQDHPPRFEYRLTEKGRDLFHVITALRQWGDDGWLLMGPLKVRHKSCGHEQGRVDLLTAGSLTSKM